MTDVLDLADRALALVDGADAAQVTVTHEGSLTSRFARSRPTQATAVDDLTVDVFAVVDGHPGAAQTNATDEAGLRAATDAAVAAARAARATAGERGPHPGLPAPSTPGGHHGFDAATADPGPAAAGAALQVAFDVCGGAGAEAFGIWSAGRVRTAVVTSAGARVADDVTDAYLKVIARLDGEDGPRSGWGACAGVGVDALDAEAAARRATARLTTRAPAEVPAEAYPVVLLPDAVGTLLDFLGSGPFNGLAYAEERSALGGRLGTRVAAPSITLVDDPAARGTLPRAFDAEGVGKAPLTLIDAGTATAVVHDTASAALAGGEARSTGHALAPGGFSYGPIPTNLTLAPGDAASIEALCAGIERGLLVTRLWYVNVVHERSALLTGTTRDGTFWIEDGEIAAPARDVRFTDSPLRILEHTSALGLQRELVCEADFYGRRFASGVLCPALRAEGFVVTGASPR